LEAASGNWNSVGSSYTGRGEGFSNYWEVGSPTCQFGFSISNLKSALSNCRLSTGRYTFLNRTG
jgi:hypothetical protein